MALVPRAGWWLGRTGPPGGALGHFWEDRENVQHFRRGLTDGFGLLVRALNPCFGAETGPVPMCLRAGFQGFSVTSQKVLHFSGSWAGGRPLRMRMGCWRLFCFPTGWAEGSIWERGVLPCPEKPAFSTNRHMRVFMDWLLFFMWSD